MPRISSKLVRQARAISPRLAPLLRATGSLERAHSELKWIENELPRHKWTNAVNRRACLEPLQYILGSQPFGLLDILCGRGVLIPRWETEEWATAVASIIKEFESPRILDACTGTGCIPLLLKHELPHAKVQAFDFSEDALRLAGLNKEKFDIDVSFNYGDVFDSNMKFDHPFDLVTANPPYIPINDYERPMLLSGPEKSVRLYEPRLALVGHLEFYHALVDNIVHALQCSGIVFELGYEEQAQATAEKLGTAWLCGRYNDSAGRLRCVVGWKKDTPMQTLANLVNGGTL